MLQILLRDNWVLLGFFFLSVNREISIDPLFSQEILYKEA